MIFVASFLEAKGVRAGTIIKNQATLNFSVGDETSLYSISSNEVKDVVSQVLNFVLKWQDSEPCEIYEGAKDKVLNLSLRNDGNGKDTILLSFLEDSAFGSLVESMSVFVDSNKNGYFDKNDKSIDEINLDADEQRKIFLVTSLKENISTSKDKLEVEIKAKSKIGGSGIKGTVFKGRGENGVDAIDGVNGGIAYEKVDYKLIKQSPTFIKRVEYFKKQRYYLVSLYLDFEGNANLKNLHLTDRVPRGLSYRKNSIRFNKRYQSDKKDGDFASFDFNINKLSIDIRNLKLPNKVLVTYILNRRRR